MMTLVSKKIKNLILFLTIFIMGINSVYAINNQNSQLLMKMDSSCQEMVSMKHNHNKEINNHDCCDNMKKSEAIMKCSDLNEDDDCSDCYNCSSFFSSTYYFVNVFKEIQINKAKEPHTDFQNEKIRKLNYFIEKPPRHFS